VEQAERGERGGGREGDDKEERGRPRRAAGYCPQRGHLSVAAGVGAKTLRLPARRAAPE